MSTTSEDSGKPASRWPLYLGILLTLWLLFWYLIRPLPSDIGEISELVMFVGLAAAVTLSFAVVAKQFQFLSTKQGISMTLVAVGFALWAAAEGTWFYYYIINQDPFPSIADAFWIVGYLAFIVALSVSARNIRMKFNASLLAIWAILSIAMAVIVIGLDVLPLLSEALTVDIIITIAYPIEDILVIIPALVIVLKFKSGEVARPWGVLVLGFLLTAIGDVLYAFEENAGTYASPYSLVDLFLSLGYLACLVSALLFIQVYQRQRVSS